MNTNFKKEDIVLKDGRTKKEKQTEKQRECDILVELDHHTINLEINKRKTNSMEDKNLGYLGDMLKNYTSKEICQININSFDRYKEGKEIYKSSIRDDVLMSIFNCTKMGI